MIASLEADRNPSPSPGRYAILGLCFALAMTEGYDLQAAAVGAMQLRADLSIEPRMLGWIFSAGTFGHLVRPAL
jgi:AAHS family 3-hydroxyphenylpropionic acid transporter